jgi:hypothetical protein
MPPAGRIPFFALTQDLRPGLNCVAPSELGPGRVACSSRLLACVGRFDWTEFPLACSAFCWSPLGFNRRPLRVTLRRGESAPHTELTPAQAEASSKAQRVL